MFKFTYFIPFNHLGGYFSKNWKKTGSSEIKRIKGSQLHCGASAGFRFEL
jgi:hypothetical protein